MVPYNGSKRSQIGQKWVKMCQNWGFPEYFGHQIQLNSSLWMLYVRTHNNMMQSEQIKQNKRNLAPYKGHTRPQIGHKWAKMCQNWGFSEYFGYQIQLDSSLWMIYVKTYNNKI